MMIKKAESSDLEAVRDIAHSAIKAVYPHYYPAGAVEFFLEHHCDGNIIRDIEKDRVFLLKDDNGLNVGTVTVAENEMTRLFVLPEYQGNGYGSVLIGFAEERIAEKYDTVMLDASFPAKPIYLKKGYSFVKYNSIECANGDKLCYDEMIKKIK
ncbi:MULTISPECIES: GNAT family N-acetyltransferase [Ruminococcus]|uniref:Ribosomal protein S18 acetylase RimI n=1 Tax=Ruminococcus flavefaciens TaxID=1265 RepID=A0A1M7K1B6_RUMFL|nr:MULTISPECIES: GNAT family N-acetyltransferase [Ruminococcus]MCR4795150.1 GNAT family N-acetyltransferase [Ruminococcus sp.]SHM59066.1 Ribosomal protein S18 acetylase RimI [Ruminococcus flavefaciens]